MVDHGHEFLAAFNLFELKPFFMKKISGLFLPLIVLTWMSCGSPNTNQKSADTSSAASPSVDSAANNGIIPPSAAPGNAGNSSLADTTYKDSSKTK